MSENPWQSDFLRSLMRAIIHSKLPPAEVKVALVLFDRGYVKPRFLEHPDTIALAKDLGITEYWLRKRLTGLTKRRMLVRYREGQAYSYALNPDFREEDTLAR